MQPEPPNPMSPPYPPAEPQPVVGTTPARRGRTGLLVGAVVLVMLVAAGAIAVVLGSNRDRPVSAMPTTPPASLTATVTPTETEYTGTLQALAIPMPGDATRETLAIAASDGTLTLEDVVEEYADSSRSSVRDMLTNLEFNRGIFLAWTDQQGFLVYLQIYQFHYERQAAAWWAAEARGLTDIAESTSVLDEVGGGKVITTTTPNGRAAAHARFCKGDFAVMLSIFRDGETDLAHLKDLAIDQFRRLP